VAPPPARDLPGTRARPAGVPARDLPGYPCETCRGRRPRLPATWSRIVYASSPALTRVTGTYARRILGWAATSMRISSVLDALEQALRVCRGDGQGWAGREGP